MGDYYLICSGEEYKLFNINIDGNFVTKLAITKIMTFYDINTKIDR